MNYGSEEEKVALGGMGALTLAEVPEVACNVGEETGESTVELAEALAGDGAGLSVDAVVRSIDDVEEELGEGLEMVGGSCEGIEGDDD